jgi:hypothetical protein
MKIETRKPDRGAGQARLWPVTVVCCLVSLISGCMEPQPQYTDPLAGLHNTLSSAAPSDAPVTAGPTVALVMGSNIERTLQNTENARKTVYSVPIPNVWAGKDAEIQPLITGGVGVIRAKYPGLQPVDDLAAAEREKFATTIVIDFNSTLGARSGQTTTAKLIAVVLDSKMAPISRIEAIGETTVPFPAVTWGFQQATTLAVAQFRAKVDQLLR